MVYLCVNLEGDFELWDQYSGCRWDVGDLDDNWLFDVVPPFSQSHLQPEFWGREIIEEWIEE